VSVKRGEDVLIINSKAAASDKIRALAEAVMSVLLNS